MSKRFLLILMFITTDAYAMRLLQSEEEIDYYTSRAECKSIKTEWNEEKSLIFTIVKLIDMDTEKEITLRILGGKVGDIELVVTDKPNFQIGNEFLLLLSNTGKNSYPILHQPELLNSPIIQPLNITALPVSGTFVFARWNDLPVDFRVDPGILGGGDGLSIIVEACSTWNSIVNAPNICGSLVEGQSDVTGSNFSSIVRPDDGINDVIFDEDGSIISSFGTSSNTLGIGGFFQATQSGEILDGFLVINGKPQSGDFLATAVHELGHTWGIAHTAVGMINNSFSSQGLDPLDISRLPTMFPLSNPLDDTLGRTLEPDDIAAFITNYNSDN